MIKTVILSVFAISLLFVGQNIFAQSETKLEENKLKAKLIHTGSYQGSELESLHIDMLGNEIGKNPNSRGFIVVYCGKNCQYGEVEAHLRGISHSLRGKTANMNYFVISHGGFKEKFTVEYWLVPNNACLPTSDSTINIKDVKFKGKYKSEFVPYDCCEY